MTDKATVFEAWSAVMEEVRGLGKHDRNSQQGFNFRGIDAVTNAVGPVLRKHRVIVAPVSVSVEHGAPYHTKSGTEMHPVSVIASYRVWGPGGDFFDMQSAGEAADSGDKATPKAMSVAFRTALLQSLTLPTDEPDPDESSHERAESPVLTAAKNRVWPLIEGADHKTKMANLTQLAQLKGVSLNDPEGLSRLADELEGK